MKIAGLVAVFALAVMPVAASAQSSTSVASGQSVEDVLRFLLTTHGVQTNDFDKDRDATEATRQTLTRALLTSLATLPIGNSSSGFSYRMNPDLATFERASPTFGSFFIEQALTAGGARTASFGLMFHFSDFTSLDGNDLRSGGFVTTANQFRDQTIPFDFETLTLSIKTRTTTFFANVGLSNRIDLGAAVPLVALDIEGTRLNTYYGSTFVQASARAHYVGLADIAVRSKVRLLDEGPQAVSAAAELRLPTGREENLLGSGKAALRLSGLGSIEAGVANLSGNMTFGTGGFGHEASFGAALAVAATPRLTIVGELLTRRIEGVQSVGSVILPHPRIEDVDTLRLMPSGNDLRTTFAVAGFKWNITGTWLLRTDVLVPLSDRGLTAKVTPAIAFDYSFVR